MKEIVQVGHEALRQKAKDVPAAEIQSPRIQSIIATMKELLSKEELGVALAAPQIGESLRIFIVSGHVLERRQGKTDEEIRLPRNTDNDLVLINPEITKMSSAKKDKHEGCLSLKGKWGMVPRAEKATIRAYNEHGVQFTRGASGFLAHIFQHEMDHLDGILYTDKAKLVYNDEDAEKITEEVHD